MKNKLLAGFLCAILLSFNSLADAVALNPSHPERHVVVRGDTLWDISAHFLRDPWLWPEVWYVNPQIANPHLIYPGDIISLVYVNGKPQLRMQRGYPTIKLTPQARISDLNRAIPTIPIDAIKQFLGKPLVVDSDEFDLYPYIVESADEHLITGAGDRIYVRGIESEANPNFYVFRPGSAYTDPETKEVLGYEALYIGDAVTQSFGDPATLKLTSTTQEAGIGDRLTPALDEEINATFTPKSPEQAVEGQIISVVGGVAQIGQYQVVVVNRGKREGMEPGHVLAIYQTGKEIRDQVSKKFGKTVRLPDEHAGLLMVFRSFEKVSFALVMEATRAIHVLDTVRNP